MKGLDQVSAGAAIGSFFAVLALFAPPVTLLGMVSPFAVRLAIEDVRDAGSVAGRLYALSTAGSLLGTFLAALVLIPSIGTRRTHARGRPARRALRRGPARPALARSSQRGSAC